MVEKHMNKTDKEISVWEREKEIRHEKHLEKSFTDFMNELSDVKSKNGESLAEVSGKKYVNGANLYKTRENRNVMSKEITLDKGELAGTYRVKTLDVREYFNAPKESRGLNIEADYDTRVIGVMNNETQEVSALKMKGFSRLGFAETDEVAFINALNGSKEVLENTIKLENKVEIRDMNALRFAMEKATEGKQKEEITAFFKNFVTENEAQYKRYVMKTMANKAVKKLSDNLSLKKFKNGKAR